MLDSTATPEYQCVSCKAKPLARYMTICEDCALLITVGQAKIAKLEARIDDVGELKAKIKQLEAKIERIEGDKNFIEKEFIAENKRLREAIEKALKFRITSSMADNVNNLSLLHSELKKAMD